MKNTDSPFPACSQTSMLYAAHIANEIHIELIRNSILHKNEKINENKIKFYMTKWCRKSIYFLILLSLLIY